jgi:ribosomal protein S18 acetylase RimI-like enzyme
MEIRPLRGRPDARGVLGVNRAAWRAAYDDIVSDDLLTRLAEPPTADEVDRWVTQLGASSEARRVLVADVGVGDPRIVGYVFVRWTDTKPFVAEDEAGLKELYVAPDQWRGGVGTALLDRGLAAVPDDRSAVALETLAENDRGRAFYETHGFERTGASSFDLDGETYPTVVYARPL